MIFILYKLYKRPKVLQCPDPNSANSYFYHRVTKYFSGHSKTSGSLQASSTYRAYTRNISFKNIYLMEKKEKRVNLYLGVRKWWKVL